MHRMEVLMASPVRILGAFIDTLYLNVYATDASYQVVKIKIPDELKLELDQWKQMAQDEEENILTRFVFDGQPLLMTMKGAEGFNWIIKNGSINNGTLGRNTLGKEESSTVSPLTVKGYVQVIKGFYVFQTFP